MKIVFTMIAILNMLKCIFYDSPKYFIPAKMLKSETKEIVDIVDQLKERGICVLKDEIPNESIKKYK